MALAALLFGLVSPPLWAHWGARNDLRADLDAPRMPGVTVELHQDHFAPQLVLSNRSGQVLEILDEQGRAFVRIGPQGVSADHAADAFYKTLTPVGMRSPPGALSATPRWKMVAKEPAYGWFDARLAYAEMEIPPALLTATQVTPLGGWRIPVRLGGKPMAFTGRFLYQPAPTGTATAVLRSPAALAPGLQITLIPGAVPAFLLHNRSSQTVQVLDPQGRPFIRVGADGAWADFSHPMTRRAVSRTGADTGWLRLSADPVLTWLDDRAAWPGPAPKAGEPAIKSWALPLRWGSKPLGVQGETRWQALPPQAPPALMRPARGP